MHDQRGEAALMVGAAVDPLMGEPERLARFYAEAGKLAAAATLELLLAQVVDAARSLADADTAQLTVADSTAGGGVFRAGERTLPMGATLEREILAGGRRYGTLRVTTTRARFRVQEEALIDLLCIHTTLAIERLTLQKAEQLVEQMRNLLWEPGLAPPAQAAIRELGDLRLDLRSYQAFLANRPIHLTISEFRLLELLSEEPGRAYSRQEIASRLWGTDSATSLRTADSHIGRLRRKIEPNPSQPTRLQSVRGLGYRLTAG